MSEPAALTTRSDPPSTATSPPAPDVASRADHRPASALLRAGTELICDLSVADLGAAVRDASGPLWVDIDSTDEAQLALLSSVFRFHPLAIEDTVHPNSRVKVEEYAGYLFITTRVVRFMHETDDPYDLHTGNLYLFIGPTYLVTVHGAPAASITDAAVQVRQNPDLLARGTARIAHLVLDAAVDAYFPILDQIDEFVDGLEARVFERFDDSALQEIFRVKRLVVSLRRYLAPQREVFNVLTNRPTALLPPETQLYFRDIYDHILRINESLESYRDLLSGTLDAYLSQVSNRLGQITKGLSVVATMSIPFVVVSGMWGMNFVHIPLSHDPHGFAIMMVVQLALGGALVALLRWRGLF